MTHQFKLEYLFIRIFLSYTLPCYQVMLAESRKSNLNNSEID